jgi:threonine synthase
VLYGKLEFVSPTGSFKDRGNAIQVSVLKEVGVTEVADVAINNAGQSCAAYCARAGIRFIGFIEDGPLDRKAQATAFHDTAIHPIRGDRRTRFAAAEQFCKESGILFMNYGRNAYFIEGQKTMAYEIAEQMDPLPEHIIVPVGNGSILLGLWRGFSEMHTSGRISRIPRLYGVQTKETQPLVAAFYRQAWHPPVGRLRSIAIGIGITDPPRLEALVEACRASGGRPLTVTDSEIISWQKHLAKLEGLFVEPTSAIVVAAAQRLRQAGDIAEGDPVLLPLTGAGVKEPVPGGV